MADFILTWAPPSDTVMTVNQDVQYKKSIDSTWTTHANVANVVNTHIVPSLLDNTIYNFRVCAVCLLQILVLLVLLLL
jgi:hypothetical protein